MAEFQYQDSEAWNTAVRLATSVGRLKVGSNLKASQDAHTNAFQQAGQAAALIAEATGREGPAQLAIYREARGALAQCRAWLHILATLMNEPDSVFGAELDLAELGARQVSATLRALDRGPSGPGPGPRPPMRGPGGPAPRGGLR